METERMDTVLMLLGQARHCGDCDTTTVFLPVDAELAEIGDEAWICTACDAAVVCGPVSRAA